MPKKPLSATMDVLKTLRKITEGAGSVSAKTDKILKAVLAKLKSDAAACYVAVDTGRLELFAHSGAGAGKDAFKRSVRFGDTLAGEAAQKARAVSRIEKAGELPHGMRSAIAIPLIKNSKPVGVLAALKKSRAGYSAAQADMLETVAMVLGEMAVSEEMRAFKKKLAEEKGFESKDRIKGVSLGKGFGMGAAAVHRRRQAVERIFAQDKEAELAKLGAAITKMNADLDEKLADTKLGLGEHASIFDAYKMFAEDKGWHKRIADGIAGGMTAEAAVERAFEEMKERFADTADSYLLERLHDLRDISDRLLSYLSGDEGGAAGKGAAGGSGGGDIVVVAKTMGPADLMDYDHTRIRGLVIEDGTPTMHVVIVAKALNIPVISKTKGLFSEIRNGQLIALDGEEGMVYLSPDAAVQKAFKRKIAEARELAEKFKALRNLPAKTLDGVKIGLYINVGLSFDLEYLEPTNCDGIGLYRTEIPFMSAAALPSVDEQAGYYRELLDRAKGKRVIFRSLDVGSDKLLPYWSRFDEENPAIGWRSIRITLDRRALLRKQLRAFLKAAEGRELSVMFPMVSDLSEFLDAKETLMLELERERKKSGGGPNAGSGAERKAKAGLMIEVPSIVFQLDSVLQEADFISIGTNDLSQFFFACDRGNMNMMDRYDVLSAPFLRMLRDIAAKAAKAGVYCSVCGEMASNPVEAMALIGAGCRNLSVNGSAFGRIKSLVRSLNAAELAEYVNSLLESPRRTLRPQLIAYAYDHGIEIY